MGFIKEKQSESSIYTTVSKEQKIVRPLWKRPLSFWQHWIAKVVVERGGKAETLRNSSSEPCAEDNTCTLCNTPDPMWDHLSPRDKFRRDGSRSDFGRSLRHGLPVWDYANQCIKMLVGGNSLFQGFDEAEDAGIDITAWDWVVWKSETNNQTSYHSIRSNEQTQFNAQITQEQIQAVVGQFQKNDVNCDTSENLVLRIGSSTSGPWDQQQAFGQPQQPQQQLPQNTGVSLPTPGQPPMPTNSFVQGQPQVQTPPYTPPQMQQQPVQTPQQPMPQAGQPFGNAPQQTLVPPQPQVPVVQQPQVQMPQQPLPLQATPEPAPVSQPQVQVPQQPQQAEPQGNVSAEMTQEQMDRATQVPTGKYQGKNLEWLMANDANYFKGLGSFLKNYPDIVAARDRLQAGNYPAVSPPSAAVVTQQAPVVMAPPVQNIQNPQPVATPPVVNEPAPTNGGADRDKLEAEVNALFMSRSDLWMKSPQGVQAMATFLTETIGTTAYNQASAEQLMVLKQALEQRHADNPQQ
jgi:hypothetical protein